MKIHSRMIMFGVALFGSLSIGTTVLAATPQEVTEPATVQVSDSQIVEVLPEGGFIYNYDGSSTFDASLVEQNDAKLMTYQEYKDIPEQDSSVSVDDMFPVLRAANPFSQKGKVLANGEVYVSNEFSGSGWRFSNLKFIAANGTGTWLKWTSINDSGRAGHFREARDAYNGRKLAGVVLEPGKSRYVNTASDWLYYYTFNPARGTKYMVENR